MAQGNCFGQGDAQLSRFADGDRNLSDLDGVSKAVAQHVVIRRDEHLTLTGKPAESRRMLDAVPVPLETKAEWIRVLGSGPVACAGR
jgi:hypothetical protein